MTADTQQISDITTTDAWQALQRHHDEIGEKHLREFFHEDPARGTELASRSAICTSTTASTASPARR